MNKNIYLSSLKNNRILFGIFALCSLGTIGSLMWIFPDMTEDNAYSDLLTSLPEGLLNSLGIVGDPSNLNEYMNMNFYNSIYLYILIAFVLIVTTRLISRPVGDTSLVYYLNSPVSRNTFFQSQVLVFITGLLIMTLTSIFGAILTHASILSDHDFSVALFVKTNLIIMGVFLVLGGFCLIICSVCNSYGASLAFGGAFLALEYLIYMVKNMSESMSDLKYATFFTIFDPEKIANDENYFSVSLILCIVIAAIFMLGGKEYFKRRDLHL